MTSSATVHRLARRRVMADAIGIGIATGTYGLSFGALAVIAGLSIAQTCALSLLMFTGASQFAFVGVVAAGGSAVAAAASAILLGSRNALYGLHLSQVLSLRGGVRRAGAAHLVIDESAAMSFAGASAAGTGGEAPGPASGAVVDAATAADPADRQRHAAADDSDRVRSLSRLGFYAAGLSVFVGWNAATLVGALGAQTLSDPGRYGLDAVAPAAFLALLAPRLRGRRTWYAALLAVAVALATAPLLPAGAPVLLAALAVVVVSLWAPSDRRQP